MAIPQNCVDVLQNGIQHIGSADLGLKPSHDFVQGSRVNLDEGAITVFVQRAFCESVVKNSETVKRAVFYSALVSHEAYQVKGNVTDVGPISEEDVQASQKYCQSIIQILSELGLPPENTRKIFGRVADTAITIKLEQIFNQTPGPQAGKPIS